MNNSSSKRQKINTELAVRAANTRVKKVIEDHTPKAEQIGLKIDFYCECSNAACRERVAMTLEEYEKLHDEQSKFVIVKGHTSPEVEKITKTAHDLQVVDKFAL